jgi:hypothetical protein
VRTVHDWNQLDNSTVSVTSVEAFSLEPVSSAWNEGQSMNFNVIDKKKTINLKTVYILISDVFFHKKIVKIYGSPLYHQMKPEFTCYNLFGNIDAIG